jgi:dTMP kinase
VDAELGLQRRANGGEWNRLDAYTLDFHRRVRLGYHQLAAAEPQRWVIVDAGKSSKSVQEVLRQVVLARLSLGKIP